MEPFGMFVAQKVCNCELRDRQWNLNTGKCERCGSRFVDGRPKEFIDIREIGYAELERIVGELSAYGRPVLYLNNKYGHGETELRLTAQFFANEIGRQVAVIVVPSADDGVGLLDLDAPNSREWCRQHGVDPDKIAVPSNK